MQLILLLFLLSAGVCVAYPDGAPEDACVTMMPDHFGLPDRPGEGRYALTVDILEEDMFRGQTEREGE